MAHAFAGDLHSAGKQRRRDRRHYPSRGLRRGQPQAVAAAVIFGSPDSIYRDLVADMLRTIARLLLVALFLASASTIFASDDDPLFHSINPLALRDDWGRLHQMPNVDET